MVRFTKLKLHSTDQINLSGKLNVADVGVTDDVTGQVKVKMFDDMAYLVCLALQPC